jgi:hypothetical protein
VEHKCNSFSTKFCVRGRKCFDFAQPVKKNPACFLWASSRKRVERKKEENKLVPN